MNQILIISGEMWICRGSFLLSSTDSLSLTVEMQVHVNWTGPAVPLGVDAALRLVQGQIPSSVDPVSGLSSYLSGKQWAAVRTQQDEIRLPPQRNTFSLDLCDNMAATQGWDSTVATVLPMIFICFLLMRHPHVDSVSSADETFICLHLREWSMKMTSSLREWRHLCLDQWLWAEPGLILQDETVLETHETQTTNVFVFSRTGMHPHDTELQRGTAQYSHSSCWFFTT